MVQYFITIIFMYVQLPSAVSVSVSVCVHNFKALP